jgi:hypothetical protein
MSTLVEIRKQLHAYEFNVINAKLEELSIQFSNIDKRILLLEQAIIFEKSVVDVITEKKIKSTKDEVNVVQQVLETINDTVNFPSETVEVNEVLTEETSTVTVDDKKTTKVRKGKNKK